MIAWPALVDKKTSVDISIFENKKQQHMAMWKGIRRLLLLNTPSQIKYLHEKLSSNEKLGFYFHPYGTVRELIDDCINCGVNKIMTRQGGLVWTEQDYFRLQDKVRGQLNVVVVDISMLVKKILSMVFVINKRLQDKVNLNFILALSDIKSQVNNLVYSGFITSSTWEKLDDILRYLRGIEYRLDKLSINYSRDRSQMLKLEAVKEEWKQWFNTLPVSRRDEEAVIAIRWMIEELRISFFSQKIGTPVPVSVQRIQKAMDVIHPSKIRKSR